ncbi:MAG: RIO1 family regulatory kinase/ATPase [Conexivisphaerales archaeon]
MPEDIRRAANLTTELNDIQFKVLYTIAKLMNRYDSIPPETVRTLSDLSEAQTLDALKSLVRYEAVVKRNTGYGMLMLGLDTLALHDLAKKGMLSDIGPAIGVGKESDVYECLDMNKNPLALKVFRLGRISFRALKKRRDYAGMQGHKWLLSCIIASEKEDRILKMLEKHKLPIPSVRGRAFHTLLMDMELGIPLYKVKKLDDAYDVLASLLQFMRDAYNRAGVVNGDLSEFNVLITPQHKIIVIDWPQAIMKDSPIALPYLMQDIDHILSFFRKKYDAKVDKEVAVNYVLAKSSKLF